MKIPEPLFVIVNPLIGLVLRSPLHLLLSKNVLLVTFKGRKTGRMFTTPLRYIRDGNTVRCFSSENTKWWRNMRGGVPVTLRLAGKNTLCQARVLEVSVEEKAYLLSTYLSQFPQDASYHEVSLDSNRKPSEADIAIASETAVMVEFTEKTG